MKIFNIDGKISSNLLTNLRSFNEIFMKNVSYDNIMKTGPNYLSRRYIFGKTTAGDGGQNASPPTQLLVVMNFSGVKTF